ncbi:amino acid ABC transporter permease [Proteiniborus sp.]|uniref:amino acid ABC transporter permease n=1 Tax=Proteiniborus sp. TaxID=2079015 RepID=UPI003317BE7E
MMLNFDTEFFISLFPIILKYVKVTLKLSIVSLICALLLATIIALVIYFKVKILSPFLKIWVSIFRGTPLVTQLFFIYFGLAQVIPFLKNMNGLTAAILGLSLNASAHMSETLRGAISSVDKGQIEACLSIGMTNLRAMTRVVLPQAMRVAIPALSNSFVDIIKGSAMAFTIGVTELMGAAQMEGASNYKFFETFTAVMLAYWIITSIFGQLQKILEKKLNSSYS